MATHNESYFRKSQSPTHERWTKESTARMLRQWGATDLSRWVPETL
jgi:hypothetical protein